MISNREKAITNLSALKKLMKKGKPEQLAIMNLVQILEGRLESTRGVDVSFRKDEFDVLMPVSTAGGFYDLLITVSLRRVF